MKIEQSANGGVTVVKVTGDIDQESAHSLRDALNQILEEGIYNIIADLCEVPYISATGLGTLVSALKRCMPHGGWLVVVSTSNKVNSTLKTTKLGEIFKRCDTIEEAVRTFEEGIGSDPAG